MAILCLTAEEGFAQDKRPINNKKTIRQTRAKSVKHKEKATTRDIAGYKLRTLNKSSAQRAIHTSTSPYKATRKAGDRAGKPIGGKPTGIRSRSINAGRANIYPQKGPFVNHSSRSGQKAYDNRQQLSRLARLQTRHTPPGRKARVTPRSNSQAYVTRGRKNVYWGKYSKGERAFTTDLAGRPLRTKNFRTPANPVVGSGNPYYGRKDRGDRAYKGTFRSGYATASRRGERAWKGDISGHAIRKSAGRQNQVAGQRGDSPRIKPGFSARLLQKDLGRISGTKTKKGGGSVTGLYRSNKPLAPRQPGIGGAYMKGDFARLKGIKPEKGGGSVSGKYKSNRPLMAKAPGANANFIRKDLGKLRGVKPIKGGGSISAKMKSTHNKPLSVRLPGNPKAASMQANYRGTTPRIERSFSQTGLSYTGNIRTSKPIKGGGSASNYRRNNNHMPIAVRQPLDQRSARFQGNYKGFMPQSRASRNFSQEGLSHTGNIKGGPRQFSQVGYGYSGDIRQQKRSFSQAGYGFSGDIPQRKRTFSQDGYGYSGDIRMRKKSYSREGYDWSGYAKANKPLKGGGSVSGQLWNNKEQPLPAKYSASKAARFQGNLPFKTKSFSREGYDWAGYDRTRKPEKGGGSISGQLWNNKGEPLPARIPTGKQAGDVAYSGKIKLPLLKREYVRNPNAVEEALKKRSPYENVYKVNNLTTAVKQKETGKNPLSAKGALAGLPPSRATVKAGEYSGTMKRYWEYKHNPISADDALKTIKYSKSFADATSYAGKVRLTKNYRHSPNAHKDALKVLVPGKAYARIGDYQGNIRMNKFNHKKHFPDATFAHNRDNNVKGERTILTNIKLFWAGIFKRQSMQPDAVKDKVRKPRYDKKEKELWKDLYD